MQGLILPLLLAVTLRRQTCYAVSGTRQLLPDSPSTGCGTFLLPEPSSVPKKKYKIKVLMIKNYRGTFCAILLSLLNSSKTEDTFRMHLWDTLTVHFERNLLKWLQLCESSSRLVCHLACGQSSLMPSWIHSWVMSGHPGFLCPLELSPKAYYKLWEYNYFLTSFFFLNTTLNVFLFFFSFFIRTKKGFWKCKWPDED